jgi:predicted N-acyltransferase
VIENHVTTYTQVQEIPGEQWNALAQGEDFTLTTPMLALTERARPKTACYFLYRDQTRTALGALPMYLMAESTTVSSYHRPDLILRRVAGTQSDLQGLGAQELLPAAFLGSHQPASARLLIQQALSSLQQRACIIALLTAAEAQARDWGVRSLCCPYVAPGHEVLREVFSERGYVPFPGAWFALLDIRWSDFAGYLNALSGHQRRIVRWERRKVAAAGFEVTTAPLDEEIVPRLEALKSNVARKYHGEPSPERGDSVLAVAARERPGEPIVTLARKHGEIVGFGLCYRYQDQLYCEQMGFDYEQIMGTHLYFEVAFYQLIDYATTHGIRRLHYGPEAYRAKRLRGCVIEPQTAFLTCADPDTRQRLASVARMLDVREAEQERELR